MNNGILMRNVSLGPSPPRRDDPMISGPLSSLPPDLESRLAAARQRTPLTSSAGSSGSGEAGVTPRQRPSDIMAAAVTARASGVKTPGQVSRGQRDKRLRNKRVMCWLGGCDPAH